MDQKEKRKIGEILIEDGLLTREQLAEALALQKETGGLLGQVLVAEHFVEEDHLISALGKQFKIPYISLGHYAINPDMADLLKADFCHKHFLVAFDCDSKKIFLALADPLNGEAVEQVKAMTGRIPQVFLSRMSEILNAIYFLYHEKS